MNTNITTIGEAAIVGFREAVVRAAADPNFNVETVERLAVLHNAAVARSDDIAFNAALSVVQSELKTIAQNMHNPQTRSMYANYAALDREVRPIYTENGFSVSFTTEPSTEANMLMVVGMLTHGAIARRYQLPVPIDTTGFKGTTHMTRTHAILAATTYGKRALLTLMFNLATDEVKEDKITRPVLPLQSEERTVKVPPVPEANLSVITNETTGETAERVTPFAVEWEKTDTPRSWGEKLMACLRTYCHSVEQVDGFVDINRQTIDTIRAGQPGTHKILMASIAAERAKRQPFLPPAA